MSDKIRPYDLTRGESVKKGYFAALEAIMQRFCLLMESYLFDQFKISCQIGYQLRSGQSFKSYAEALEQPLPIFRFGLTSLKGESLMVMENSLANLFLFGADLFKKGRAVIPKGFRLTAENHEPLKASAEEIMALFQESYQLIEPSELEIHKLVSHRVKAQIMSPEEPQVTASVTIAYKAFKGKMEFCFSAYQLDPMLKRSGKKALLTRFVEQDQPEPKLEKIHQLIEERACYLAKGTLGKMRLSHQELAEAQRTGKPIPLQSEINGNVIVSLNGEPVLSATAGASHGKMALKINGEFKAKRQEAKEQPVPFAQLTFPKA